MANNNPRLNPENQTQTEATAVPTETTPLQSPEPQPSQNQPQPPAKEAKPAKTEKPKRGKKPAKESIVTKEESDEYPDPELKVPNQVGKHFTDNLRDPNAELMTVDQVIAHMATVNNVPREFNRLRNNGVLADEETTRNALRNKGFSL